MNTFEAIGQAQLSAAEGQLLLARALVRRVHSMRARIGAAWRRLGIQIRFE